MEVLKQVLGIDVAQKELVVSLGRKFGDLSQEIYAYKVFKNTERGMDDLLKWTKKLTIVDKPLLFVMEATGVYHEKFAYFLDGKGYKLSILLPNKISNYIRTLDIKTVTDKTCSEAISQFGLERKLTEWKKPNKVYKNLKQLTRERDQIVDERVVAKNQLHAEESEACPNENTVKRIKARIKFFNKQEAEIKRDIEQAKDEEVKSKLKKITTIPGVGDLTATIILAETNGFELIKNKKQLTSYAGLDIKEKQSGTSIKGKPRISKKGNRSIRKAMHLPALAAIKHDENYKAIYNRLVSKNGVKMKGVVAVQRKLLELIYVIYRNDTTYEKDYEKKKREQQTMVTPS
ncbi:MAG: IS110 family transposase [Flavobacteriia bacterium]|jgi:transposase